METTTQLPVIRVRVAIILLAFDRTSTISFGGYFDSEIIYDEGFGEDLDNDIAGRKDFNFRAHRLVMEASARLSNKILFNSEIEYEYGGNPDKNGEIKIEQAWVDYKFSDKFTNRIGIVLIPFGVQNILHDSDVRDLTDKGLYSYYIVPSTWFDTGVGAHGHFELGSWEMDYEGYVINGLQGSPTNKKGIRGMKSGYEARQQ